MTAVICDPAEFQELLGLLDEQLGIDFAGDTSPDTFVRDLLTACKTKSATLRLLATQALARRAGRNPDSPVDQFSTEGDSPRRLDAAALARRLEDAQERHRKNPNFAAPAY